MAKEEFISGEQHKAMTSTKRSSKPIKVQPLALILGLVVIVVLSFFGGTLYQKHTEPKTTASAAAADSHNTGPGIQGQGRRFGGGQRGEFGKVTAISSSSITLANQRTNKDSTLNISAQTIVSNNGQTGSVGDIKVGDTVLIIPDTTTTSQAARILLNPSFGDSPGSNSSSDSSPGSTQLN